MKSFFFKLLLFITVLLLSNAELLAQVNWTKYPGNPVLAGQPGTWYAYVTMNSVLYNADSSRYETFEIGGPNGDTGMTGRKIIVDTYGGTIPHGGGAFSGKDPTKVDRSAAYMCRYIAKNLVAAGLAKRCLVQLAYAIGVAEPVSLLIETYGTGSVPDEQLEAMVRATFRLTPLGIIDSLDLRRPIYRKTAAYGHFGRAEPEFTWERVDQARISSGSNSQFYGRDPEPLSGFRP